MRTFLIIIGIWLLINVLFVVIMMPPRKPRRPDRPRSSASLAPAAVEPNAYPFDEDEKISLRHTIIAIAMGALFSLTPPLLQAADASSGCSEDAARRSVPTPKRANDSSIRCSTNTMSRRRRRQPTDPGPTSRTIRSASDRSCFNTDDLFKTDDLACIGTLRAHSRLLTAKATISLSR